MMQIARRGYAPSALWEVAPIARLVTWAILRDEGPMGASCGSRRSLEPRRHGLCALVTRPRAEAESLAAALAKRGVDPLIEPLLEIHYNDAPAPDFAGVQAILCTSANGVRALARVTDERSVALLAVGDASAARARDEGFARVESAGGSLDDLASLVRKRLDPADGRLLHVAGADVAGDLAGALRAAGFAVDRAVLYEARPVAGLSAACVQALDAGDIDLALFFSPRTARLFAELAERAGVVAAMASVCAISISNAADAGLGALGFRERHVAERPDQRSLLAALDRVLAQRHRA